MHTGLEKLVGLPILENEGVEVRVPETGTSRAQGAVRHYYFGWSEGLMQCEVKRTRRSGQAQRVFTLILNPKSCYF